MDLTGFLKRKLGPLPMGAWIFIAVVVAFALVKLHGKKATAGGTTDPSAAGQFSTSQTTTDSKGNTTTYTANGPNSSIQSPAQLTTAAGAMPYSGGDVYVNIPGSAPAPASDPAYVQRGRGFWYIVPSDSKIGDLAGAIQAELQGIASANPQIDWSGKSGGTVKAGTPIWIPQAPQGKPGGFQPGTEPDHDRDGHRERWEEDPDHRRDDWKDVDWAEAWSPLTQTTSMLTPLSSTGRNQLTDAPGNGGDSLFNPDNVQKIFG